MDNEVKDFWTHPANMSIELFEQLCEKFKVFGTLYRCDLFLHEDYMKNEPRYLYQQRALAIRLNFDDMSNKIISHIILELKNLKLVVDESGNNFTQLIRKGARSHTKKGLYATKKYLDLRDKIGEKLASRLIRYEDGSYDDDLVKEEYYHGDTDLMEVVKSDSSYQCEFNILYHDFVNHEKILTKLIYMTCYSSQ